MATVKKYKGNLTEFKDVNNLQWPNGPLKPVMYDFSDGTATNASNLILNHLADINNLAAGESMIITIQAYNVEE